MHCVQLLLTLSVLIVKSTSGKNCTGLPYINAIEGEPFHLKPCNISSSPHKNEAPTIKWSKMSPLHERAELNTSSSLRITLNGYSLEFWPVELSDEGMYFAQVGNDEKQWNLTVIQRNEHSCFPEKLVHDKQVGIKKLLEITCENPYYQNLINSTSLYKNCKKISQNKIPQIKKNMEPGDQGYYSCVFSIHRNGKQYNITSNFNVTISKDTGYNLDHDGLLHHPRELGNPCG